MATLAICWALSGGLAAAEGPELVDVGTVKPPLLQEIRYATAYNFTGEVLYPFPKAFVRPEVAEALGKVQAELAEEGLGLKIWDGYRPVAVQQRMWELIGDERYVSNPAVNKGRHTRGTSVDVTLVDRMGNELRMPTGFDDFTERAHRDDPEMSPEARENMLKLQGVMARHGFLPYPFEWWHFDLRGWEDFPVQEATLEELVRPVEANVIRRRAIMEPQ